MGINLQDLFIDFFGGCKLFFFVKTKGQSFQNLNVIFFLDIIGFFIKFQRYRILLFPKVALS